MGGFLHVSISELPSQQVCVRDTEEARECMRDTEREWWVCEIKQLYFPVGLVG